MQIGVNLELVGGFWVASLEPVDTCPPDIAPPPLGDGTVNVADLLLVIVHWGGGPGNPADVNGDNVVNVADLLAVISGWGMCP